MIHLYFTLKIFSSAILMSNGQCSSILKESRGGKTLLKEALDIRKVLHCGWTTYYCLFPSFIFEMGDIGLAQNCTSGQWENVWVSKNRDWALESCLYSWKPLQIAGEKVEYE